MRAIAALAVLTVHVAVQTGFVSRGGALSWLVARGDVGVPVFFTLSGLLLYRPWAAALLTGDRPPRTGRYLYRRALRILPAYWALVVCVMVVHGRDQLTSVATWVKLATLSYVYDPHPWWGNSLGPRGMGQIWSLTVEVAWYATLPPLALALAWWTRRGGPASVGRRARRLLAAIGGYAAISVLTTVVMFVPSPHPLPGMWLPHYVGWFAIGMALAVVSIWARAEPDGPARRFCRTTAYSWGMCWTIAALLYCIAATPLTGPSNLFDATTGHTLWTAEFHVVGYGLIAAFFVAPVALAPATHPAMSTLLGNRVMRYLGRISYSLFLWQLVIILGLYDLTGQRLLTGNLFVELPPIALVTVGAAALGHRLLERPAMRLSHRKRRRARTAS